MAELADRENAQRNSDREFYAAIHGARLKDHAGRPRGTRQSHMERMKQRRGVH